MRKALHVSPSARRRREERRGRSVGAGYLEDSAGTLVPREPIACVIERERIDLAEMLHDGPVQRLASFGYTLDVVERKLASAEIGSAIELVQAVRAGLTRELGALRRLMADLRSPVSGDSIAPQRSAVTPGVVRAGPGPTGRAPRVLVAEDDPMVRNVLVALLAEHGFDVVGEAVNGLEAVALASRLEPDLVVMDFKMPELDGREATRLIRAHRPGSQIVLLSGDTSQTGVADCLREGAFEVVAKGGSSRPLFETLERAWRSVQEQQRRIV